MGEERKDLQNFKGRVVLLIMGLIFFISFFSLNSSIIQATPLTTNQEEETSPHLSTDTNILTSPKTPFMIGMSYFSQGEYDKAIIEFEKSIELDPDHAESYYYLGLCYVQKGIIQYNNKNISAYISLFRKAYKISNQTIPLYEQIIKDNPEDLNSYLKLGYIYETRSMVPFINEYNEALEYYLKALDIGTSSSSSGNIGINIYLNIRIGRIYFKKKKYSQTIEYLERAEKLSPHNVKVIYYLGLSYDKIGEKEKAREFLSRVIELAPQSDIAQEAEKKLKKINKD